MFAVPFLPFLHGPQRGDHDVPGLPRLADVDVGGRRGPVSLENFSCQPIFAPPLAFSTAVPVNVPVAPAGTPVGFGTSAPTLRTEVSFTCRLPGGERQPSEGQTDCECGREEEC